MKKISPAEEESEVELYVPAEQCGTLWTGKVGSDTECDKPVPEVQEPVDHPMWHDEYAQRPHCFYSGNMFHGEVGSDSKIPLTKLYLEDLLRAEVIEPRSKGSQK